MKTSARNQFSGKIVKVVSGAINDEVELEVVGGQKIIATITHQSTKELGLNSGVEAFALIKSSSVIVAIDDAGMKISARNRLSGTVSRVQKDAVNSEVTIELTGGGSIVSIVTNKSVAALELTAGAPVAAIFKASSVILGVPA